MNKFSFVYRFFVVLFMLGYFTFCDGVSAYPDEKIITEEERRGAPSTETKNVALSDEDSAKSKTFKRGLLLGDKRQYGIDGFSAPSGHGAYDSGKYGPLSTGFGLSGGGHYDDDRRPSYYDQDIGYHHSGGGYVGKRPSGPSYGPSHNYPIDYDDRYPGPSGGDQGVGGFKMSTIKKFLLPLAGLAILGVAAAASQNPVLLPLGTLSGRRRRSLLPFDVYPPNPHVRPKKTN